MIINDRSFGIEVRLKDFIFVFGNKKSNVPAFQQAYPQFSWARIKQVHGDLCVQADSLALSEADAQWTSQQNQALCISTADCVPVLVADLNKGSVASIHAGWKGVAERIVPKTLQLLIENGSMPQHLQILIGPHIQFQSFEVHEDVLQKIKSSLLISDFSEYFKPLSKLKYLVDLNGVVKAQLQEFTIQADQIFDFHYDTKTDPNFHSHRRDQASAGRQISFVANQLGQQFST